MVVVVAVEGEGGYRGGGGEDVGSHGSGGLQEAESGEVECGGYGGQDEGAEGVVGKGLGEEVGKVFDGPGGGCEGLEEEFAGGEEYGEVDEVAECGVDEAGLEGSPEVEKGGGD